jgi:retinol dehydrogenase-12
MLNHAVFGAYTELFAGISPDVTSELSGSYIIPWGRIAKLNKNLVLAEGLMFKLDGGTGAAQRFYDWCEGRRSPTCESLSVIKLRLDA